jgi:hypothetical protein
VSISVLKIEIQKLTESVFALDKWQMNIKLFTEKVMYMFLFKPK